MTRRAHDAVERQFLLRELGHALDLPQTVAYIDARSVQSADLFDCTFYLVGHRDGYRDGYRAAQADFRTQDARGAVARARARKRKARKRPHA
jgi:hypothetical protein